MQTKQQLFKCNQYTFFFQHTYIVASSVSKPTLLPYSQTAQCHNQTIKLTTFKKLTFLRWANFKVDQFLQPAYQAAACVTLTSRGQEWGQLIISASRCPNCSNHSILILYPQIDLWIYWLGYLLWIAEDFPFNNLLYLQSSRRHTLRHF